ncbi:MAG: hypothetical protein EBR82_27745 [Caulobacteraceae bacterium]|nr:hypothetical protein [Caulobacteraceae bacterium]
MYEVENKLITLNSDYGLRLNGNYLSSMVFNFTGLLKQDSTIISSNVCAINAQFPVSFYIINETNNTLFYTLDETTFKSISIPAANYTANSLFTAMITAFNANLDTGFGFSLFQPTGIITATKNTQFRIVPFSAAHASTLSRVLGITSGYYDYQITIDIYVGGLTQDNFTDPKRFVFFLPIQSYTLATLATTLNGLFSAQSAALVASVQGTKLRIQPSTVNKGLAMVYSPTDISAYFGINASQSANKFQDYTIDSNLLNNTIDSLVLSQTADTPLNLLGVKKLSVKSTLLGVSSFTSESGGGKSITLTTIPVDKAPFQMISYENKSDLNKQVLGIDIVDNIDIQIVDERDNLINFNNVGWTITLVLESIRRKRENVGTFKELLSQQEV